MALWPLWQHNEVSRVGREKDKEHSDLGDLAFIEVQGRVKGFAGSLFVSEIKSPQWEFKKLGRE